MIILIEILIDFIVYFIGLGCGVMFCDKDLKKDVETGIIKVDHKVYVVKELKGERLCQS